MSESLFHLDSFDKLVAAQPLRPTPSLKKTKMTLRAETKIMIRAKRPRSVVKVKCCGSLERECYPIKRSSRLIL